MWLRSNWPLAVVVAIALLVVGLLVWNKMSANSRATEAANEIEASDMEALPSAVVAPSRVERASRRVRDEVENEIDDAMAPTPEDPAGGPGVAVRAGRGDAAFRGGIERLRDKASRY